jgi:hypothetical protein
MKILKKMSSIVPRFDVTIFIFTINYIYIYLIGPNTVCELICLIKKEKKERKPRENIGLRAAKRIAQYSRLGGRHNEPQD